MGGAASSVCKAPGKAAVSPNDASMQNSPASSAPSSMKTNVSVTDKGTPKWRRVLTSEEARRRYEDDGTIPVGATEELLELRGFLDDPLLMKHFSAYSKHKTAYDFLLLWVDIEVFKSLGAAADDFRRTTAARIHAKYLQVEGEHGSVVKHSDESSKNKLSTQVVNDFEDVLNGAQEKNPERAKSIKPNALNAIQLECIDMIYKEIFVPFKKSSNYAKAIEAIGKDYNRVYPDDFEYMELLGEGHFGVVVHARKKSTGKHYALKLQSKNGLIKIFKSALHRLDFEKQALVSCNHPFIVRLDYAFQTASLVLLAMQLGTAGSLDDALRTADKHMIEEERVRFYASEIVLALGHIHQLGMIYRDLKPQNILLNEDGHIQLVDLGGIIDPGGKVLGKDDNGVGKGLFAHVAPEKPLKRRDKDKGINSLSYISNDADKSISHNSDGVAVHSVDPVTGEIVKCVSHHEPAPMTETFASERVNVEKAKSITGTAGYMAVEMQILQLLKTKNKGYSNAVDWFSLGITLYVLLVGSLPFKITDVQLPTVIENLDSDKKYKLGTRFLMANFPPAEYPGEYKIVFDCLHAHEISHPMINLIIQLIDFNEKTRLGSPTNGGIKVLKVHDVWRYVELVEDVGGGGGGGGGDGGGVGAFALDSNSAAMMRHSSQGSSKSNSNGSNGNSSQNSNNHSISISLSHSLNHTLSSMNNTNRHFSQAKLPVPVDQVITTASGTHVHVHQAKIVKESSNGGTRTPPVVSGGGGGIMGSGLFAHSSLIGGNNAASSAAATTTTAGGGAAGGQTAPSAGDTLHTDTASQLVVDLSAMELAGGDNYNVAAPLQCHLCWDYIEQRQLTPPYLPQHHEMTNKPKYKDIASMLKSLNKAEMLEAPPSLYYEEYFQSWDYISPQVLKMEYGIATVQEQYDQKYKARQLLGAMDSPSHASISITNHTISK